MTITIAVIDTGISAQHLPHMVVLPGINLSGCGNLEDTSDYHGHGTKLAETISQIAPHIPLIPIRIMDNQGSLCDPENLTLAFEWIIQHQRTYEIGVICAAVADFTHRTSDHIYRGSALQKAIATLRDLGVPTVAPAGNWYPLFRAHAPQGMAWPAILRETISVGAVKRCNDGYWVHPLSQRLHLGLGTGCSTTIFAESGKLGNTSGACAVITGYVAEIRSTCVDATVDELIDILLTRQQSGRDESELIWPTIEIKSS
jgi:subtilisin family serine protease